MKKIMIFCFCSLIVTSFILKGMDTTRESIDLTQEISIHQEDMKKKQKPLDYDKKRSGFGSFLLCYCCVFGDVGSGSKVLPTVQGKIDTKV